jgi:peptide/nickel transport system permease protein
MAAQLPNVTPAGIPGFSTAPILVGIDDDAPSRFRALTKSLELWLPFGVLIFIIVMCFIWPEIFHLRNPSRGNLAQANIPPFSPHYILGTDTLGNDEMSEIFYGGRVSLEVGFGSVALGLLIGGLLGVLAGYRGGLIEAIVMRILDMFLAFPSLVLALTIATYLGPSEIHVIWAISFFSVPAFARLARAGTLRLREQPFVVASKLSGSRDWRILIRHIAPNIFPQLLTFSLLGVAVSIIVEATLDFLGLGVPAPHPSWGRMIANGQTFLSTSPYLVLVPSAFLFLTVASLNLTGDALRARWGDQ